MKHDCWIQAIAPKSLSADDERRCYASFRRDSFSSSFSLIGALSPDGKMLQPCRVLSLSVDLDQQTDHQECNVGADARH